MLGFRDSGLPETEKAQDFFGIGFDPLTDSTAFPRLNEAELGEVAPFGERCSFDENEPLFSVGDYPYNSRRNYSAFCRSRNSRDSEATVHIRLTYA